MRSMHQRHFLDPLSNKLPALERNILKLRAIQMVLVVYYAEELKRKILALIQTTDRLNQELKPNQKETERVPQGTKNSVGKALDALVSDCAISSDEKADIVSLIKYRNDIGHRIHELVADLSTNKSIRMLRRLDSDNNKVFDYSAVERLQAFHQRLDKLYTTHDYIHSFSMNQLMFQAAESAFLVEIEKLKRKIEQQHQVRNGIISKLNAELSLIGTDFENSDRYPMHPLHKYDNGRLTERGIEVCYRLFDSGRSALAVAHLMGLTLRAAQHRRKLWGAAGGASRPHINYNNLPCRKV